MLCDTYGVPKSGEWEVCTKAIDGLKIVDNEIELDTTYLHFNIGTFDVAMDDDNADFADFIKMNTYYKQIGDVLEPNWYWDKMSCVINQ